MVAGGPCDGLPDPGNLKTLRLVRPEPSGSRMESDALGRWGAALAAPGQGRSGRVSPPVNPVTATACESGHRNPVKSGHGRVPAV
jgi:hypothetical protein